MLHTSVPANSEACSDSCNRKGAGKDLELKELGPRFDMKLYQIKQGTIEQPVGARRLSHLALTGTNLAPRPSHLALTGTYFARRRLTSNGRTNRT
jgi:hypothetical protein